MCSLAIFPSLNPTTTAMGISTLFPVGGIPGSIHGMSTVCVNLNISSSTIASLPTVRETGSISTSGGWQGMNQVE
jgi:hypothetical protein